MTTWAANMIEGTHFHLSKLCSDRGAATALISATEMPMTIAKGEAAVSHSGALSSPPKTVESASPPQTGNQPA
ncbi:hypothetical protein [Leucobacter manosquensis]|uniref:Uncharacterized protein n=1 Tax=Leucobacter manosquensis TaxID=2810611 RepID=A0ABS5M2G3_9MICO|nr:hypothetical protein [Leucobacter manosquensis]MBS3181188.1 hypothetical protein [Leucobacter manosquensis]